MDFSQFCKQFNISKLNPQQEIAVKSVDGATLLLAVPGSGKTTVLVARAGYMVHCAGIDPNYMLSLTFSKAAAAEMKARYITKFSPDQSQVPYFATIHSFCCSVIRRCQVEKGVFIPTLVDDNTKIVRQITADIRKSEGKEYPTDAMIATLKQSICKVKNELLADEEIVDEIEVDDISFPMFYGKYRQYMYENGLMDFDDQLIMAYELLQQYPDILARVKNQYRYVSLDEAQDTSLVQHKIVQMIVGRAGNIFMVGDEDQSIYGFRGAYPTALLSFPNDYDNAQVLYMETNYRSDQHIVQASNTFIKRNECRNDKNMVAFSSKSGKIKFTEMATQIKQTGYVMRQIRKYTETPNKTLAILYRNNDSVAPIISQLIKENISVRIKDPAKTFFTHFAVSDILDMLRFALNQQDFDVFKRIYFKLGLYIKKDTLDSIYTEMSRKQYPSVFAAMLAMPKFKGIEYRLRELSNDFFYLKTMLPVYGIDYILNCIEYRLNYLERKIDEGASEDAITWKINVLKSIAASCNSLKEFLEQVEKIKTYPGSNNSNITLSTIHSSKGLEFDHVIMIDINDGILPPSTLQTTDEREEEARLFYVGTTRAKHKLEFIIVGKFFEEEIVPSEFLKPYERYDPKYKPAQNIQTEQSTQRADKRIQAAQKNPVKPEPKKIIVATTNKSKLENIQIGTQVRHQFFGKGTIKEIRASGVLVIEFDGIGEKQILKQACERTGSMETI